MGMKLYNQAISNSGHKTSQ